MDTCLMCGSNTEMVRLNWSPYLVDYVWQSKSPHNMRSYYFESRILVRLLSSAKSWLFLCGMSLCPRSLTHQTPQSVTNACNDVWISLAWWIHVLLTCMYHFCKHCHRMELFRWIWLRLVLGFILVLLPLSHCVFHKQCPVQCNQLQRPATVMLSQTPKVSFCGSWNTVTTESDFYLMITSTW